MKLIRPNAYIDEKINGDEILLHLEKAGRTCYQSLGRIKQGSADILIKNLIKNGHLSVIEHKSITARIICDRGVSHELVRHRLASFSQESSRYCNYSKSDIEFIIPFWIDIEPGIYKEANTEKDGGKIWFETMLNSEIAYNTLIKDGWSPEKARSILPNSLKTEIVMTANLREWRHIFEVRINNAAHPQIKEVMAILLREFKEKIPIIYDDLEVQYASKE